MKLALLLSPALLLAQQGPQISWAACGASISIRASATCAFTIPVSDPASTPANPKPHPSILSWTATDITFSHGHRADTGSTGFYLDVWPQAISKSWFLRAGLITTANVTTTPTALIGSFSGGAAVTGVFKQHLAFTFVVRQPTGSTLNRMWTGLVGWVF